MPPKKDKEYDSDTLPEDILIDHIRKATAKDNKLKQIRELLEQNPDIDINAANVLRESEEKDIKEEQRQEDDYDDDDDDDDDIIEDTAVSLAVKKNAPELVEELIGHGADLAITIGEKKDTVLHMLSRMENVIMLQVVLNKLRETVKQGNEQDEEDEDEDTHAEEEANNAKENERAPEDIEIAFLLSLKNKDGQAAVDIAVHMRSSGFAEILLENGAEYDFHSADEGGLLRIHRAVTDGDMKLFEFLINVNQSPFARDTSHLRRTVLHHAVVHDKKEVFELLAKRCGGKLDPEFVNAEDNDGSTVISLAVQNSNWELVKLLSSKFGANIQHISSRDGMTVLHRCVFLRRLDLVEQLVNAFKMKVTDVDRQGNTSLHWAASSGAADIVQFLIDKKADVNALNSKGDSPLMRACHVGSMGVLDLLLAQKKIDHMVVNGQKINILHEAANQGHSLFIEKILAIEESRFHEQQKKGSSAQFESILIEQEDQRGHTPLDLAIHAGQTKSALSLINHGANVEREYRTMIHVPQNEHGDTGVSAQVSEKNELADEGFVTTLQHAVCMRHDRIVEHILQTSTKQINSVDANGRSPLHNAVLLDSVRMVEVLLYYNDCNIDMKEVDQGYTPLMIACVRSQFDICNFLITECGASLTAQDMRGMTALHIAAQKYRPDIVRILVEAGAEVNHVDVYQRTPLHASCEKNNTQVAKFLVENGASVAACDTHGLTSLHIAVYNGGKECTELLVEKGASMNARDAKGRTPLILASEMGQTECGRVLVQAWKQLGKKAACKSDEGKMKP